LSGGSSLHQGKSSQAPCQVPSFPTKSLPIHHSTFAFNLSLSASTSTNFPSSYVPLSSTSPFAILLPSNGYLNSFTLTSVLTFISLEHSIIWHHLTLITLTLSSIQIDHSHNPTPRGKYTLLTNIPKTPPTSLAWLSHIHNKLQSTLLPLKSKPVQLFYIIHKLHLRPVLLSFVWHLLHKQLYLHLHDTCPFCNSVPFILSPLLWVHKIINNHYRSSHSSTSPQPPHTPS